MDFVVNASRIAVAAFAVTSSLFVACVPGTPPADAGPVAEPFFAEDVEGTYTEVRDCRSSIEHELHFVRVFADELAHQPYTTHDAGFPEDAIVVKVEYADDGCTDVIGYTAMKRLADGASPEGLDWHWQDANANQEVFADGALARCVGCHERCEGGFEATCTAP